jgi:hypothetical protein
MGTGEFLAVGVPVVAGSGAAPQRTDEAPMHRPLSQRGVTGLTAGHGAQAGLAELPCVSPNGVEPFGVRRVGGGRT